MLAIFTNPNIFMTIYYCHYCQVQNFSSLFHTHVEKQRDSIIANSLMES